MDSADRIYEHNQNFVSRRIEDETILVPIKNHVGDLDSLFSLNPVGAFIWEQIDGSHPLAAILDLIVEEFDVPAETAQDDLLQFITELHEIGAVQLVDEKGAS